MSKMWGNIPWEEKKRTWTERHGGKMAPTAYATGFSLTKETKHEAEVLAVVQSSDGNIQRALAPASVNTDDPYQFVDVSTTANSSQSSLPNANHSINQVATAEVINKSLLVRNEGQMLLQPVKNKRKRKRQKKNVHEDADRNHLSEPAGSGELTSNPPNKNPQGEMMSKNLIHCSVNSDDKEGAEPQLVSWICGQCAFFNYGGSRKCRICKAKRDNEDNITIGEAGYERWDCPKCNCPNYNFCVKCKQCDYSKFEKTDNNFNNDKKDGENGVQDTTKTPWKCSKCRRRNYEKHANCHVCHTARLLGDLNLYEKFKEKFKFPIDWRCPNPKCQCKNFYRRAKCGRCRTIKSDLEAGKTVSDSGMLGEGNELAAANNDVPFSELGERNELAAANNDVPFNEGNDVVVRSNDVPIEQENDVLARTNDVPFNQGNDLVARTNDVPSNQLVPVEVQGKNLAATRNDVMSNQFVQSNDRDKGVSGLVRLARQKKNIHGGTDRNLSPVSGRSGELNSNPPNKIPQGEMMSKSSIHCSVNSSDKEGAEPRLVSWICGQCAFFSHGGSRKCGICKTKRDDEDNITIGEAGYEYWDCPNCNCSNYNFRNKCRKCDYSKREKTYNNVNNEDNISIGEAGYESWDCPKCICSNYNFRNKCRKCDYSKCEKTDNNVNNGKLLPVVTNDKKDGKNGVQEKINVDTTKTPWKCSKCRKWNYDKHENCHVCHTARLLGDQNLYEKFKEKLKCPIDWRCPKCECKNFYRRAKCGRCRTIKSSLEAGKTVRDSDMLGQGNELVAADNDVPFNELGERNELAAANNDVPLNEGNDVVARSNDVPIKQENDLAARTNNVPFNQLVPVEGQGKNVAATKNDVPSNQFVQNNDKDEGVSGLVRKLAIAAMATKIMEGTILSNLVQGHVSEEARMVAAEGIATKIIEGKDVNGNALDDAQARAVDQMRMIVAEEIARKVIAEEGDVDDLDMANVMNLAHDINNMIMNTPVNGTLSVNVMPPANMTPSSSVVEL